jgi:hypothetical protein
MNSYQKDFLNEKFSNMDIGQKFSIARDYAMDSNYDYPMETYEIDCLCHNMKPIEIIEKYGSVDVNYPYFMYNGYEAEPMDDAELNEWCDDTLDDALRFKDADYFDCWDEDEYSDWLYEEYGDDIYDMFGLDEDFPYSCDEETHAEQFAKRWGVELKINGVEYKKYPADDVKARYVFKCILVNSEEKRYAFEFGQPFAKHDKKPTMYDVLSTMEKYDPRTYKDFCSEFGYDSGAESRKIYHGARREWEAMLRLFGPEDGKCMNELREIR